MSIGLADDAVRVDEYTPEWNGLYREEAERLRAAIGCYVLDIQHIGSTSIPGLAGKPIIDIGIAVENFEDSAVCIEPLVRLGYEYKGEAGIPRRHYFVRGQPTAYHLHVDEIDSDDWRRIIRFRDYLRAHPDTANAYAELKRRLAEQYPNDRPAYLAGKTDFIRQVLEGEAVTES